jgi:inosine-uridine nucleoside N-ribohydrolase
VKFVLAVLLAGIIHGTPAIASTAVWIDTDPSVARGGHEVDDGLALIQAFGSPELAIRGVSVVFGNAPLNLAFPIGQRLLKDFGPKGLRTYSGAASASQLGIETDASRALASALREEKLVVIAIGPVTNVATVLRNHPDLAGRIERIVAVAGRRPHQRFVPDESVTAFRDFNFESDPAAFQVLLDAGVPLALVPWEISSKVWIHAEDLAKLRSARPSLAWVLDAAQDLLQYWTEHLRTNGFNPFDTLAVGYVVSPAGFSCEQLPAEIQLLPDDTVARGAPEVKKKPYLILDKTLDSKSHALYCFQPPAQFSRELVRRMEHAVPVFDHSVWNELTGKYINSEHRVDYRALKEHELSRLDAYLVQFAAKWPAQAASPERKATLIDVYNALTVRWILSNYPVESVWRTKHPFTEPRHNVDGAKVSLDQIEARLRVMGDPRIHAALVCASRSCPPLRREAYEAGSVDEQLDDNLRVWLADTRLNEFFPERRTASVSMIFKWYGGDFRKAGGSVEKTLAQYGPSGKAKFLLEPGAKLEFKPYNWGLNDRSSLGANYSRTNFYWDALRNK